MEVRWKLPAAALAVAFVTSAAACSATGSKQTPLTLHIDGRVSRSTGRRCVFALRAALREGGTQRTCLESVDGFPGPDATMHSKGLMTFALRGGAITLRVRVRQRFAGDGAHARQSVHGVIVAGRGRYAGAHGSIAGGGTLVDTRAGVRAARLAYTIRLTR